MNKLLVLSVFAVLACAFAAPATENEAAAKKSIDDAVQQCKTELNPSDNDYKILENKNQLPANEAQKCLIECVGKKLGEIKDGKLDHDGFINYNKIRYADNKSKLDEAEQFFQKCQPEVEKKANEKCGAGYAMRSCLIDFFHL
ncbi:uncharacterized protein LOC135833263 [Planococcus citri]|uniref:uncharacterized protein LOC135833263 n=1 Tax=Planococcus citri TaxID=170843 RepID=UPI0031F7D112